MAWLVEQLGCSERDAAVAIAIAEDGLPDYPVYIKEERKLLECVGISEPLQALAARARTIRSEYTAAKTIMLRHQKAIATPGADPIVVGASLQQLFTKVALEAWELDWCTCGRPWPFDDGPGVFVRLGEEAASKPLVVLDRPHHHCEECDLPAPAQHAGEWWVTLQSGARHPVSGFWLVTAQVRRNLLTGQSLFVGWACHRHRDAVLAHGPHLEDAIEVTFEQANPTSVEGAPYSFDEYMPDEASLSVDRFEEYQARLPDLLDKARGVLRSEQFSELMSEEDDKSC